MGRRFLHLDGRARKVSVRLRTRRVVLVTARLPVRELTARYSDETLAMLGEGVRTLRVEKSAIGWGLEALEALAHEDAERLPDSDDESEDEIERMLPAPL